MKLLIAITGASGAHLGLEFIRYLPKEIEPFLIMSDNAKKVLKKEYHNIEIFDANDIAAAPASGSFGVDATAIIPCSMNTLAKIALGISDNLITRAALVAIKEQKKLLLAPREMPLSPISLEHMSKLAHLGVIIAPPIIAYYSQIKTIKDLEKFLIGKWYDVLGIEHNLFKRWE